MTRYIARILFFTALVFSLLGLVPGQSWADGFIVVTEPVHVPEHHFSFAPLEVKSHHVKVKIDGQIATTTVDEEFYNPNPQQVEGTYLFPIPKLAQIDKFSMEIDGHEATAELLNADKARDIYEDIVRRRLDPALLEYADQSVFKVHIFPIEGGSRKQVKIVYSELLKADSGLVSYIYPMNTEKFSAAPINDVSVSIDLTSTDPLASIYSPSHDVEIKRPDPLHATVGYEANNVRPDTDFQLYFSTKKKDAALNLITYRDNANDDGYFMLLASPGALAEGSHLPKDVTFVLDTSGSMSDDDKLVQAKKALIFCLSNLNPEDHFEIVRFSTEPESLFGKLTPATDDNISAAKAFVSKLQPNGGTAIYDALHEAMKLHDSADSSRPYTIVFLTDGEPTVGETSEDAIVGETDAALNKGTRIFCFGLGTDVNARLLDRIAEHTHAVSDYVLPTEDIEVKVSNFFSKVKEPVLSQVKLNFPDGIHITKMYPQTMPDLFKGDQVVVCGRYSGSGTGDASIEGVTETGPQKFTVPLTFADHSSDQPFVSKLWATRRVGFLLDQIRLHGENDELKQEATDLAKEFGLVTPYTAYLITEDEERHNVSMDNRVFKSLSVDKDARAASKASYDTFASADSGSGGVEAARAQNQFKLANNVDSALKANREATHAIDDTNTPAAQAQLDSTPSLYAQAPGEAPLAASGGERLVQYTQTSKFVAGRAFYQNGTEWVDSRVSQLNSAKVTRIQFGSEDYFALITKHPEATSILSLGRNVKLALADGVYEIYPGN